MVFPARVSDALRVAARSRYLRLGLVNVLGNVVAKAVFIAVSLVLIRTLAPDEYAAFSLIYGLLLLLGNAASLSLGSIATKHFAAERSMGAAEGRLAADYQTLVWWVTLGSISLSLAAAVFLHFYLERLSGGELLRFEWIILAMLPLIYFLARDTLQIGVLAGFEQFGVGRAGKWAQVRSLCPGRERRIRGGGG